MQHELYANIKVDGFSGWIEVTPLKSKRDICKDIQNTIERWEIKHRLRVAILRHDHAELATTTWFVNWAANRVLPIEIHSSLPYAKEFDGTAEHAVKILKDGAVTCMMKANLHNAKHLTIEALSYVAYVNNRLLNSRKNATPYQHWNDRIPDISHLRPFGCQVTIWQDKTQRKGAYSPKGVPGIFLGFRGDTIIRVVNLKTRTIQNVFHVEFLERFPGLTRDPQPMYDTMSDEPPPFGSVNSLDYTTFWNTSQHAEADKNAFDKDIISDDESNHDRENERALDNVSRIVFSPPRTRRHTQEENMFDLDEREFENEYDRILGLELSKSSDGSGTDSESDEELPQLWEDTDSDSDVETGNSRNDSHGNRFPPGNIIGIRFLTR